MRQSFGSAGRRRMPPTPRVRLASVRDLPTRAGALDTAGARARGASTGPDGFLRGLVLFPRARALSLGPPPESRWRASPRLQSLCIPRTGSRRRRVDALGLLRRRSNSPGGDRDVKLLHELHADVLVDVEETCGALRCVCGAEEQKVSGRASGGRDERAVSGKGRGASSFLDPPDFFSRGEGTPLRPCTRRALALTERGTTAATAPTRAAGVRRMTAGNILKEFGDTRFIRGIVGRDAAGDGPCLGLRPTHPSESLSFLFK
jgi:hypothetical protein